jgi:TniQ/Bacterial regulatory helix-turn-helix protein, lysR family
VSVAGDRDDARDMISRGRVPCDAAPRELPIRLAPVPEEAFDSWLERYAARLQARLVDVVKAVGLAGPARTDDGHSRAPLNWTVALRPAEIDRIARATGVDSELLAGLTLQRYDGIAVLLDLQTRRVSRYQLWGRGSGSRFCPACLAETGGRWSLRWRLSWSFCCLRHRVLLVDHCPGCGRTPRTTRPRMLRVPEPGRCSAPSRPSDGTVGALADRCGVELAQDSAVPADMPGGFLDAQAFVNGLLDRTDKVAAVRAVDGTMLPTAEVFADLKAVAAGVLNFLAEEDLERLPQAIIERVGSLDIAHNHEGRRVQRPGFMAPRTAARMAFAVSKAVEVVAAPDIDTAAERVSWIIDRMRRRGLDISPTSVTRSWGVCSPVLQGIVLRALDTTLRPSDRLRYRTATPRPQYPQSDSTTDGIDTRAAKLPQQLWPAWALRLMPPSGHHFLTFRRVTSTALLLPGGRRQLDALLPLLGQPFPRRTFDHVMRKLADSGDGGTVLRILSMLAVRLDDAQVPIDYQRRRRLFGSTELLPEGLWKASCARADVVATERKRRLAERYLLELLTGSPDSPHPPLGPLTKKTGVAYAAFCTSLRPALAELLRAAAEQQLADHRLGEPLVWEPPFDWSDARAWPGPHVDSLQPAKLQRLLINECKSLSQAAAALGTSMDHIRLVLIRHPIGPLKRPQAPLRSRRTVRRANLTPEYIAYRYEQCGWSYQRIAKDLGADRALVRHLAALAGVKTRPPGRSHRYDIDPRWLAEQYLVQRRNLVDIAAELGMHPNTIDIIARRLGLPHRPLMAGSNMLNVGGQRVACAEWIRPAFNRRGALLRVQRFLTLIEYPSYKKAAMTLNIPGTILSSQVLQLERDLGASLLVRAKGRGQHPLRLTRTGRRFVREARKALANLQAAYGS